MALYLTEIVSVSGKPGLYKMIGKRPNGLIVEALDAGKKRFATNLTQKVSFLSDISMYTYEGDVSLADVLVLVNEKVEGGLSTVTKKDGAENIKSFFRNVLEDYDEDQVYNSDIIKLCSWYTLLKDKLDFGNLIPEENDDSDSKSESKKASKPKTKTPKSTPKAQSRAKGGSKISTPRKSS